MDAPLEAARQYHHEREARRRAQREAERLNWLRRVRAVECDTVKTESAFWRDLERELKRDVDARPLAGATREAVAHGGEQVYEQ